MTQEDKELLFKDLSARLPYGVKAYMKKWSKLDRKYYEGVYTVESVHPSLNDIYGSTENGSVEVILGYSDYDIKPYLFPLSSMTEEQAIELYNIFGISLVDSVRPNYIHVNEITGITFFFKNGFDVKTHLDKLIDWLNKNHFDYRGLIEKGLALDATDKNIY